MNRDYRDTAKKVTLLGRCRHMRREPSDAENRLWHQLRDRQLAGFKFRRQHQFGPYILDFFCPERNLAIEVDGGQHYSASGAARDARRTAILAAAGIQVMRFTNLEVLTETDAVIETILGKLNGPHPDPLPEGEGVSWSLPEGEGVPGLFRGEGADGELGLKRENED